MSTTEFQPTPIAAYALSPDQLVAFTPDPERGRALYDRIKHRLAESFRQIAEAISPFAEIDEPGLAVFVDSINRSRKISPRLFAIYNEMLAAAEADDVAALSLLFGELTNADSYGESVPPYNLTDEHLGPGNARRYARWADMDEGNPLILRPLDSVEYSRIAAVTSEAFTLMDAGASEVSGEIRSLLAEVIFAHGGGGSNLIFHGISSFYLWGTVLLNAEGHNTALEVAQTLAHETSQFRDAVFTAVNMYRRVDAPGVCQNNMEGGLPPDFLGKLAFITSYKFTLAVENSIWPGYTTEKLVQPMFCNSIPIYVGDPLAGHSFNENSYIDFTRFSSLREMAEFVREVDNNKQLYLTMLATPSFTNNEIPGYARDEAMEVFFDRIFAEAIARRS